VAATLCAVHCVLTPILAAAVPVIAVARSVEWWALAVTVGIGGGVTFLGPTWKDRRVATLLTVGALIWLLSLLEIFEPLPEWLTSSGGALVFASGMLLSAKLCRTGECEVCEPGPAAKPARPGQDTAHV
jgi:hypothetical protein